MIYLDSNVFIYSVVADEKTEKKTRLSKEVLIKLSEGKMDAATSILAWGELVWTVRKFFGEEIAKAEGKKFLEFPNLKILGINVDIIAEAQRIMETYRLKPRDSMHAACAIKNSIRQIITDDPDFDKLAELKRIALEKTSTI